LLELNVAHAGLPEIEKVSGSPSASLAVGVKEYVLPDCTLAAGVPEITGALLAGAFTVMEKVGNDLLALPSLTLMTMFEYVPACWALGVPVRAPLLELNVAHAGLPLIEKVSGSPSASLAVGVNEYVDPDCTLVGGVPEITGALLAGALTVMEKAGNDLLALPSLTLMMMLEYVPTCCDVGVPDSLPVVLLNKAHAGLFAMENVSGSPSASLAVGVNV
jgi:hypothetical protein